MKRFYLAIATVSIACASGAYAQKAVRAGCNLKEDITLNVNFNMNGDSFAGVKVKYDEKMKSVQDFAAKQSVKKFDLTSMNYSINSNDYNGGDRGVQLNGNASYRMASTDEAFKLAEFLSTQKFNVSMSSNAYDNENCNNTPTE